MIIKAQPLVREVRQQVNRHVVHVDGAAARRRPSRRRRRRCVRRSSSRRSTLLLDIVFDDLLIDIELDTRGVLPGGAKALRQVDGLRWLDLLMGPVSTQATLPAH